MAEGTASREVAAIRAKMIFVDMRDNRKAVIKDFVDKVSDKGGD